MDDVDMTTPAAAVSLPGDAVMEILCRTPVKFLCRFRCVSKGWRDLISSPVFLAEHKSRHRDRPFLVDTGPESRDLRLMDMDVRVFKGAGGSGMLCGTSLDDLICVDGGSTDGAHMVDPVTGEVLLTCPPVKARNCLGVLKRRYTTFGFGRAVPSGAYKMVRRVGGWWCEILTLGLGSDDAATVTSGWRKLQARPIVRGCYNPSTLPFRRGSPISINGVMYMLATTKYSNDTLLCLDLESEQWRKKAIEGPRKIVGERKWRKRTTSIRITELNGDLCMVQTTLYLKCSYSFLGVADTCVNIWILADPDNGVWTKAHTIPVAPYGACRYMPLRVVDDIASGKLLLHCYLEDLYTRRSVLLLQLYDPRTNKCTDVVTGTPANLAGRIGLCNLHLEQLVTTNNRRRHS